MLKLDFRKWCMVLLLSVPVGLISCGGDQSAEEEAVTEVPAEAAEEGLTAVDALANPMQVKGVGPVQEVVLEPTIHQEMAAQGKQVFEQMCTACHKIEERFVGPALKEVTTRRSPEWIMNMILNPENMVKEDPIAKELLKEYLAPMANQNLTQDQARQILEYFRTLSEVDSLNYNTNNS